MFCTNCGKQLDDKMRFCTACGTPVDESIPEEPAKPAEPEKTEESAKPAEPAEPAKPEESAKPAEPVKTMVAPAAAPVVNNAAAPQKTAANTAAKKALPLPAIIGGVAAVVILGAICCAVIFSGKKLDLTVVVNSEDGSALEGAEVSLTGGPEGKDAGSYSALTDAEGKAFFTKLPEGSYEMSASKEYYKESGSKISLSKEDAADKASKNITLSMLKGTVTVKVLNDATGTPMEGTSVGLSAGGDVLKGKTDEEGIVEFKDLTYGTYTIAASDTLLGDATGTAELYADSVTAELKYDPEVYTFSMDVQAANIGKGIEGAHVDLYRSGDDTPVYSTKSNEVGHVQIKGILPGSYTMRCTREGYWTEERIVDMKKDEDMRLIIVPEPADSGYVYVLLTWEGDQDLDLCSFNSYYQDYLTISNDPDKAGSFVHADNKAYGGKGDDALGYELVMLYGMNENVVKNMYVVDTAAAMENDSTKMEEDGVHLYIYGRNGVTGERGLIWQADADPEENAPLWNPCYIYNGDVFKNDVPYIRDVSGQTWVYGIK
ncbi:MAG: carboxypeptidase regulatory-like domain-containing protein [Lachnospiraceae bacterium]|nr:carboxypeptidase regulatory-like domain-containing protein [Lachnospiraceae bacterium]